MTDQVAIVILVNDRGTRMKSKPPKVLHSLAGRPMLTYSLDLAEQLNPGLIALIVSREVEAIKEAIGSRARYVERSPQSGTGHAVLQAASLLEGRCREVIVLNANMPLFRLETLQKLIEQHRAHNATLTVLAVELNESRGFGRIVRDESGHITEIIDEYDATSARRAVHEMNTATYVFQADWLWAHLPLRPEGGYDLADSVALAATEGRVIGSVLCTDSSEALSIRTRVHLAEAEVIVRKRINERLMLSGVTIIDPSTTYIEAGVQIEPDTIVCPNTHLQGKTIIGSECTIGPNTIIRDSTIGNRCEIEASVVEGATLEDEVDIGPFAHLRKGAYLCQGVHMGNFGEVKNSRLGPGTKMGHFSYLGDATVGANVNIGCGTVTCNYDGQRKHPTRIEDDAFLGSGTMLVAPVHIGEGATTGAGSVVTCDVPDGTLVYGVPARARLHKDNKI